MTERELIFLSADLFDCVFEYIFQLGFLQGKKRTKHYHDHSVWEIQCIVEGDAKLYFNETELELHRNDVFLIPPKCMHCVYEYENTRRMGFRFSYEAVSDGVKNGVVKSYFDRALLSGSSLICFNSPEISGMMKRILFEYPTQISDYMATHLAENVILSVAQHILPFPQTNLSSENRKADSIRTVQLEEYLIDNYEQPVHLSDIAELYHLSEKQTERVILRLFGKTYSELLLEKRLSVACFLLTHTEASTEEIANTTGFGSVGYFYRCFKKAKNMTPGEYKIKNG